MKVIHQNVIELTCRIALAFGFTSSTHLSFFSALDIYNSVSNFSLKEEIGEILIEFCARLCILAVPLGLEIQCVGFFAVSPSFPHRPRYCHLDYHVFNDDPCLIYCNICFKRGQCVHSIHLIFKIRYDE